MSFIIRSDWIYIFSVKIIIHDILCSDFLHDILCSDFLHDIFYSDFLPSRYSLFRFPSFSVPLTYIFSLQIMSIPYSADLRSDCPYLLTVHRLTVYCSVRKMWVAMKSSELSSDVLHFPHRRLWTRSNVLYMCSIPCSEILCIHTVHIHKLPNLRFALRYVQIHIYTPRLDVLYICI
jgi:hypothetical protein